MGVGPTSRGVKPLFLDFAGVFLDPRQAVPVVEPEGNGLKRFHEWCTYLLHIPKAKDPIRSAGVDARTTAGQETGATHRQRRWLWV